MRVRVRETKDGFITSGRLAWAPGAYSTPRAAARAAWNMRDHGTPDELPESYTVERRDDGRTIYRLTKPKPTDLDKLREIS